MNTVKTLITMMLLQLSLCVAGCQVNDSSTVSNEVFKSIRKDSNVVILDVRTAEEFKQGHIQHARNIDVLQEDQFNQQILSLPKDKTYLIYCRSGKRSATALHIMKEKGFINVKHLDNGIVGWDGEIVK